MHRLIGFFAAILVFSSPVLAQNAILQGGPWTQNHAPMYSGPYSSQPVLQDSGGAVGGSPGLGMSESLLVSRGVGLPPFANSGSGPYGTNSCNYDGPKTSVGGYHFLCTGANAQGGGLIAYGAGGGAAQLPFSFIIKFMPHLLRLL